MYAPRRAASQPASESEAPLSPSSPDPNEPEQASAGYLSPSDAERVDIESEDAARARIEDAIRAISDVGRSLDEVPPHAVEVKLPPAANLISPPIYAADGPVSPSDMWPPAPRGGRYGAEAALPYRRGLTPDSVPEPPSDPRRGGGAALLARYGLAVGFAAVVAYGFTMISSSQFDIGLTKHAKVTAAAVVPAPASEPVPQSQLVVEDQKAFANEPLPLDVAVDNPAKNQTLQLAGLSEGAHLSAGVRTGPSSWRLPLQQLKNLYLYAPTDFVGVMNTNLDLLAGDEKVIDRRGVRLEWLPKTSEPSQQPVASVDRTDPAIPNTAPVPTMASDEAATLMKRGQDFMSNGDITSARIVFERLAESGFAQGALAAASAYDPRYLAAHNVFGVRGDEAKARALYQRAMQLGSAEAGRILAQMATK